MCRLLSSCLGIRCIWWLTLGSSGGEGIFEFRLHRQQVLASGTTWTIIVVATSTPPSPLWSRYASEFRKTSNYRYFGRNHWNGKRIWTNSGILTILAVIMETPSSSTASFIAFQRLLHTVSATEACILKNFENQKMKWTNQSGYNSSISRIC